MFRMLPKIIHHTKNQGNLNKNENKQSIDANKNVTHMLGLHDKDFEVATLKAFQ